MNFPRAAVVAVLLLPFPAGARPRVPAVPSGLDAAERQALQSAEDRLAQGQFAPALAALDAGGIGADTGIFVDWTPVPSAQRPAWKAAAQAAVEGWNRRFAGEARFHLAAREEEAGVLILFEQSVATLNQGQVQLVCQDGQLVLSPSRLLRARTALLPPYATAPHTPASIRRLVSRAIGLYLGLAPTAEGAGAMGPDPHADTPVDLPDPDTAKRAREVLRLRAALRQYAAGRTVVEVPSATLVPDKLEADAGDVWKGASARYHFTLKNTGDAPLELEAHPGCGCTVATCDRVIAPGATGALDAELRTEGYTGKLAKTIELNTNDRARPQVTLQLKANVLSCVRVLPSENPIVALKDEGATVQPFELRVAGGVELRNATCNMPFGAAKVEPVAAPAAGERLYRLTVTIGPEAPVGRSAMAVTVATSSDRERQVTINAILEKGIQVAPVAVYMGVINPDTVLPVVQVVTMHKPGGALRVISARCDDPRVQVKASAGQQEGQTLLMLRYTGGWKPGPVHATLSVETDDARQKLLTIPVTGTVLGGPAR